MKRRMILALLVALISGLLVLSACGNQQVAAETPAKPSAANTTSNTKIKATWVKPQVSGDGVSIPSSEVDKDTIIHFKVSSPTDDMAFMVYEYGGKFYARADICPPCLSESFSLKNNTLICDACGTVFNAVTGDGITGACVSYPKASVPYEVKDGNITMKATDLTTAFQNTLRPGKP